jgi:hypothetical protein
MIKVVDGEKGLVKRPVQDPLGPDLIASRVTHGLDRFGRRGPRHVVKVAKELPDLIDRRIDDRTVDTLTHGSPL